jgi:hypothetical protein
MKDERKLVCVCGAWKICFACSGQQVPGTNKSGRTKPSHGTYQPVRVVWKALLFACCGIIAVHCIAGAVYPLEYNNSSASKDTNKTRA